MRPFYESLMYDEVPDYGVNNNEQLTEENIR